jgi:hypothetical protein
VVGSRVVVNDRPMTVVGVAPAGFEGTTLGVAAEGVRPAHRGVRRRPELRPAGGLDDRPLEGIFLFARLRPASRPRPRGRRSTPRTAPSSPRSRRRCSGG